MEIKSADEIYVEYFGSINTTTRKSTSKHNIIEAMKEYAEQFIDLAAEKAEIKTEPNPNYLGNLYSTSCDCVKTIEVVDKESILKVKQLIK